MKACDNGTDANPCPNMPEFTLRESDSDSGRWLGTICAPCTADLIDKGDVVRSAHNPFRIVTKEKQCASN